MKQSCGCCEGTEQLTPAPTANRPGLSALAYRIGTHGSFLETMLARLSSHSLGASPLDSYTPSGASQSEAPPARPLAALSTREPHDAAVAFLDAWATVADVLTFYQERIANEGYLRTATERRSLLELARLIGYRPRPGVAASVHLAYTLDAGSEVTIPAGSRSQSVPGAGELPQSFETSEDLHARAAWNLLRPRLKRPQDPRRQLQRGEALYFKGTATNLRPNDALLMVTGVGPNRQTLLRVLKVEPDQANDRTKVSVELWEKAPGAPVNPAPPTSGAEPRASLTGAGTPLTAAASASSDEPAAAQVGEARAVIEAHRRTDEFGVNDDTATARRVLGHLDELEKGLEGSLTRATLRALLGEALTPLREEHHLAVEGNFTKLEPWIGSIVSGLEKISVALFEEEIGGVLSEMEKISARMLGGTSGSGGGATKASASFEPALEHVSTKFLDDLGKPASAQPASRRQLGLGFAHTLSPASGTLTRTLMALRPGLRAVFESSWGNVPVTEAAAVSVYALRARASLFGHSAPLNTIRDDNVILRQEEWTLFRSTGSPVTDHFRISVNPAPPVGDAGPQRVQVSVAINRVGGTTTQGQAVMNVQNGAQATINVPAPNAETVTVTLSVVIQTITQTVFTFRLAGREVEVRVETGSVVRVDTTGSDPTTFFLNNLSSGPITLAASSGPFFFVEGDITRVPGDEPTEQARVVSLDASYKEILPDSWAVIERPAPLRGVPPRALVRRVVRVSEGSRADYGVSAKGTQLELDDDWVNVARRGGDTFEVIRRTSVLAQSELLELAEEPIDPVREDVCGTRIELADLVEGLEPGRFLIVSGERTDVAFAAEEEKGAGALAGEKEKDPAALVPGVEAAELVMLAGVEQGYDPTIPGDKTHTTLLLAREMAYCYRRDTLRIYGNVAHATHGETRAEVLGSGDASKPSQTFTLKQSPLTFVSAPTTTGVASTLRVRANEILWHETDTLAGLGPKDRSYATKTDDSDATTVAFGNGREGARLPTGQENVTAVYRTGLGPEGNVKAEQISMVLTKPVGVKEVINPLRASGGAAREGRDQVRRNAPLGVMALDRLVSTRDYEDFARTFAGIGKASAARLTDGRRQLVHLTVAGEDDIPSDVNSDLYHNLRAALRRFGDPYQPLQVAVRQLKLLIIAARVKVHPDYLWESVEPSIRARMLERFGFNQRALGQDVVRSEVTAAVQSVEGVAYADVDTLDAFAEDISVGDLLQLSGGLKLEQRITADLARVVRGETDPSKRIRPAQLALLSPLVPEYLNLSELKP